MVPILAPVILALICAKPQHGSAVAETFLDCERPGHVWGTGHSPVYKVLKRRERDGVSAGPLAADATAPDRKVCRITGKGRGALEDWLGDPYSSSGIEDVRAVIVSRLCAARRWQRPIADSVDAQFDGCDMERHDVATRSASARPGVARGTLSLQLAQYGTVLDWMSRFVPDSPEN